MLPRKVRDCKVSGEAGGSELGALLVYGALPLLVGLVSKEGSFEAF